MEKSVKDEKRAHVFLKDYLYHYLRKEGLINLIVATGGTIQGFSKNKYIKAPEPIIRKAARDQIRHMKSSYAYLEKISESEMEKYAELTVDEFFTKLNMAEDMKDDEKLILFFMKYPELFEEKREVIDANMKAKRPPLENIVQVENKEILQMVSNINDNQLKNKVDRFYELYLQEEEEEEAAEEDVKMTISELLETAYSPGEGHYIRAFYYDYDELLLEEEADREAFYRLLLTDLVTLALAERFESKRELFDVLQELKDTLERSEQLEGQLEKKENEATQLTTELQTFKDIEREHDILVKEVEQLREQLRQSSIRLIERDHLYVVTNRPKEQWTSYVDPSQILHYETYDELNRLLEEADEQAVYFIDQHCLSSKQMFEVEHRAQSMMMRFISGSYIAMVRTIIYYLESELRYETIKKD